MSNFRIVGDWKPLAPMGEELLDSKGVRVAYVWPVRKEWFMTLCLPGASARGFDRLEEAKHEAERRGLAGRGAKRG